jgi:hypothetical protein
MLGGGGGGAVLGRSGRISGWENMCMWEREAALGWGGIGSFKVWSICAKKDYNCIRIAFSVIASQHSDEAIFGDQAGDSSLRSEQAPQSMEGINGQAILRLYNDQQA